MKPTSALSRVPTKRIRRGVSLRIGRAAAAVTGMLEPERKLRCNACDAAVAQFIPYAGKPNRCPKCGSAAKERLVLALIQAGLLSLPERGRFLHVAPSERALIQRMTAAGEYVAADLHPGVYAGVTVEQLDLTELHTRKEDFGSFDVIYASHVLEHIPDDLAAFGAVAKSLNPEGSFWMLVPLEEGPTRDGDGSESVRDRERHFGQWDHVRQYGFDVQDRLEASGFKTSTLSIDSLPSSLVAECGLTGDDIVWLCTPVTASSNPSTTQTNGVQA